MLAPRRGDRTAEPLASTTTTGAPVDRGEPRPAGRSGRRAGRCGCGRSPRTRRRGQAEEDHDDVGAGRDARPPRRPARRRRPVVVEAEPGGEGRPSTPASAAAQLVQRDVDPGRVDLGAAGALVARGAGELADHRDRVPGGGRAAAAPPSFLQQHDALGGGRAGQRVVGVDVDAGVAPRCPRRRGRPAASTRATASVEHRLVERARLRPRRRSPASLTPRWAASPGPARRPRRRPGRAPRPSRTRPGRRSPTRRAAPR